jgi:hypothetical protein
MKFRTILQQSRHILHDIPAMGADAIQQWTWARYGVRLIISVVQQTFGGRLNFVPHLHIMVSAGGLKVSQLRSGFSKHGPRFMGTKDANVFEHNNSRPNFFASQLIANILFSNLPLYTR